jgi:hypothetical protein
MNLGPRKLMKTAITCGFDPEIRRFATLSRGRRCKFQKGVSKYPKEFRLMAMERYYRNRAAVPRTANFLSKLRIW